MSLKEEVKAEIEGLPTLDEVKGVAPKPSEPEEMSPQSIENEASVEELDTVELGEDEAEELPDVNLDDEGGEEEQASATNDEDKRYSKKQFERKIEKRISKEKKRRERVEQELEHLKMQVEDAYSNRVQSDPEPSVEDSENLSPQEYARHVVQEIEGQRAQKEQVAQQQQAVQAEYDRICSQGSEKYKDFRQTVDNGFYTNAMVAAAKAQPNAIDVLYYLGKKDEQAEEIARMSPEQQMAKVARISHVLATRKSGKKVTKAPDPADKPKPSNASGTSSYVDMLNDPNISIAELAAMRRRKA